MNRLNVLHLGKHYPPVRGGIETVLEALCREARTRLAPRALVLGTTPRTVHDVVDGVPVTRVRSFGTVGAVALTPTLPWWLARASADVIVLHEPNPMALLAYALVRPRTPLVVWMHSEVIRPRWQYRLFYEPLLNLALRRAARIVVASPPMLEARSLAPFRDKCLVVPFGIDPAPYATAHALVRPVAAEPTVLFVGRLVAYKGVEVLLRALPGLPVRAVIVGDGPCRASLEALTAELGIADRVTFAGQVSDEARIEAYRAADVFVLPSISRQEAFGMVQLEAMLSGLPVVSTALPTGVPWVNQDGRTGLVVPPGDAAALRSALAHLAASPGLRRDLGAQGRARALATFTADQMCDGAFEVYREAAARPAQAGWATALAKRALDVALSGAGLLASAPLWAAIAAAIKLEDGGPVFYQQERSGRNGVPFPVWKFRSMIPDAEAVSGAIQSGEHDPRVTRVGRLLRMTAMDELPQLWSIFRGDMSFTGPRALRPGEIESLGNGEMELLEDVPGFAARASVLPGLTGIAQIYAPRDIPRRHKFKYDLLYVRRQSIWLDVRLILLSFWITARGSWEVRGKKF
ncbi:MAG TPA: sugar transferase [Vicinamibacterales bacterium]|jgi:rhamnosyl/mannosyltransferase|nr:sugar transferase [Vicinamibacterales bacterium]